MVLFNTLLMLKRWIMYFSKWVVYSAIITFLSTPVLAKDIIIGGTGNALGTMALLAQEYQRSNPETEITVLPSIGSSGAIKAVPLGKIHLGLSSRPFKETEFTGGATAVEYARSPTVIAVSNELIENAITVEQLIQIYTGELTQWSTGELIRPIIRQANDGNTKQLNQLSPKLKKALVMGNKNPDFLFAATDQESVSNIEKIPGSFGVTTLALILSESRNIHAMSLDGVDPTHESNAKRYPMNTSFYFIIPKTIPPHVADFLDFVNSSEGKAILEKYGNYAP
jgi:phosphate transport system substrate-binding protein